VHREVVAKRSLRDLIDRFFAGSATALVSHVLDFDELNEDEIRAIRSEVDRRLRE
jgi:predicted transcriptional regulator